MMGRKTLSELIREEIRCNVGISGNSDNSAPYSLYPTLAEFLFNIRIKLPRKFDQIKALMNIVVKMLREDDSECSEEEIVSSFFGILLQTSDLHIHTNGEISYEAIKCIFEKFGIRIKEQKILELQHEFNKFYQLVDPREIKQYFNKFDINIDHQFESIDDNEIDQVVNLRFNDPCPVLNYIIQPIYKNERINETRLESSPISTNPFHVAKWFIVMCNKIFTKEKYSSIAKIFGVIDNFERSNDEIQEQLCIIFGWDHLPMLEQILSKRQQLSISINELINFWNTYKNKRSDSIFVDTVHVINSNKIKESQNANKYMKKVITYLKKLYDKSFNEIIINDFVRIINEEFLLGEFRNNDSLTYEEYVLRASTTTSDQSQKLLYFNNEITSLPNVYELNSYRQQMDVSILPENTVTLNFPNHIEICVPAPSQKPPESTNQFIQIESLSKIEQRVFNNIKTLNRIQSLVYHTAMETNENMLICAPTGAGKTNIALLTILREIINNTKNDTVNLNGFKVVYIAPMKALASEITSKFGKALKCLKVRVRELTGDMKLSTKELMSTQIIVTTPEKWDVVTRKPSGDISLPLLARLLIIDEVHLLQDERGPVIETIVARTLRLVESSQVMIRIVGLSATLPNYLDVAQFLCVNPNIGLFFFDARFRSVPLQQTFIGVTSKNYRELDTNMNIICYDKVISSLKNGQQVMIFVHTRNSTMKTAQNILSMAQIKNDINLFIPSKSSSSMFNYKKIQSHDLRKIIESGVGIHHAGIARRDRDSVESLFLCGSIKVLVCTATLSWGINLPAHTVIIKGTDVYDASKGSFVPLNILDVQQIFGRAGRPQFTSTSQGEMGHAILITKHKDLDYYIKSFVSPKPIESQLLKTSLVDVINSEIALGTITNLSEAVKWLKYTYMFVRMLKNPLAYGATISQIKSSLLDFERKIIMATIKILSKNKMVRYDSSTEYLYSTNLGRIASHFYLKYATIEMLGENFNSMMDIEGIFRLICKSSEFSSIILRMDETIELVSLPEEVRRIATPFNREILNSEDKILALIQCHISRHRLDSFSLISDMNYISQNCGRISRAFFEIALANDWPSVAVILHEISKSLELQIWMDNHPLQQFMNISNITPSAFKIIVENNLSIESIREMTCSEIGSIIRNKSVASNVMTIVKSFPILNVSSNAQPITNSILSIKLGIAPDFVWNEQIIGSNQLFWILFVEDPVNDHIYHHESFSLSKKQVASGIPIELSFYIPIFDPIPPQYLVRIISETFLDSGCVHYIDFNHNMLPQVETKHTNLLDIHPLSVSVIKDVLHRQIFPFSYFNPLQSQVFHSLYHTDNNILIGAPTGSGKTIVAEFAMLRLFEYHPEAKIVYIGPLKSLVRERYIDWRKRFGDILYKKVVELTGEAANEKSELSKADIIITTPEKWDGLSRSWKTRDYVKSVKLIIFDEVHLLGESRGAVLEAIVARVKSITDNFSPVRYNDNIRLVALSTSTANSLDLASWLNVHENGLFNFRPSVRPIPLEVHISGFLGDKYCPRMNSMNKSVFEAIKTHSSNKPVLIFASSRRQTKRTAMALISHISHEDQSKQWLKIGEQDIISLANTLVDENLKLFLPFGIGIHHAGLDQNDRKIVEELFFNQKIQILIATSTVAWGVNFPAHLVIIKGTEYYYAKTKQYVDFPITDVLQMMGRAGRPQFDTHGVAVILVHDMKKHFYKKFLYEPFPIESHLIEFLPDHINAEIVAGTIRHKNDALIFLHRTYLYQRISKNPSYYGIDYKNEESITIFLDEMISNCVTILEKCYCIHVSDGKLYNIGEEYIYTPTSYGHVASFYYISYKTVKLIKEHISNETNINNLLWLVAASYEFNEFPVRHNEDNINMELAKHLPLSYPVGHNNNFLNKIDYGNSHVKAHLLFQAHLARIDLPISDYNTDTRSLLDQSIRIIQSIIDISSFASILSVTLQAIILLQCIINGCWWHDSSLLSLPLPCRKVISCFNRLPNSNHILDNGGSNKTYKLCELMELTPDSSILSSIKQNLIQLGYIESTQICKIFDCLKLLPIINISHDMYYKCEDDSGKKIFCKMCVTTPKTYIIEEALHYYMDIKLESNIKSSSDNFIKNDRFTKPKDICWFICVGDTAQNKLYVMKRISSFTGRIRITLDMGIWAGNDTEEHTLNLYLMCDAIFGIDQQHEFKLKTKKK